MQRLRRLGVGGDGCVLGREAAEIQTICSRKMLKGFPVSLAGDWTSEPTELGRYREISWHCKYRCLSFYGSEIGKAIFRVIRILRAD
jgi:hypothetical protein